MRTTYAAAAGILVAALTALVGCGSDSNAGEVSGTISFDGAPVESGSISFSPADGKSPTAGGFIENGKYSVSKVPVGTSKVSISSPKVVGQKALYGPGSETRPVTVDLLPKKFNENTELTFDVQRGRNEKNWDLKK